MSMLAMATAVLLAVLPYYADFLISSVFTFALLAVVVIARSP
jgi:hypothetical protein